MENGNGIALTDIKGSVGQVSEREESLNEIINTGEVASATKGSPVVLRHCCIRRVLADNVHLRT